MCCRDLCSAVSEVMVIGVTFNLVHSNEWRFKYCWPSPFFKYQE